ncbi:hypothetical protein [Chitinophaga sp.]|uniref:hypothetical protein n=1 Tax=Chitinophaga sp. TaxID=1869181 RepID=UPI0031D94C2A
MKPILFLIFLITATTTITVAQSRTRDVLFPHFAEDKAKMDAKAAKEDNSAPKQNGRSSKEMIFTNYRAQSANQKAQPLAAQSRKQSNALASDISAQTALEKEKAKTTTIPTLTLPTQGEEPKANSKATTGQLKKH